MSEATNSQLMIEPPYVVCAAHGEAFRPEWPKGYLKFSMEALQYVMQLPSFIEETKGDPNNIQVALAKKPLCCRVATASVKDLENLFKSAEIGKIGWCTCCMNAGFGTKYQLRNFWGRKKKIEHRCFTCISQMKTVQERKLP